MFETKLAGVYILLATSVCVRCTSWQRILPFDEYDGDSDDYRGHIPRYNHDVPAWDCDTENKNTLAEIKSEIQNLQQLVVGLRQKLDPDFKLPPPLDPIKSLPAEAISSKEADAPELDPAESKCPPGFQYVDRASSCYKVVYEERSWTAAGRRCHDLQSGAHLAAITSSDENIGLLIYLQPELAKHSHIGGYGLRPLVPYTILWTSGQRLNETSCTDEFVWKTANGTELPLSFTYWDREEPNCHNNQPEGCLQLRSFYGFKWNDAPCEIAAFSVCEYDPL